MVTLKQGTIIKLNFNPQLGHEQAGYRPAMVVSNTFFNGISDLVIVVPITNTSRNYPTHISLENYDMVVTGNVMCEQIKAVDLKTRHYRVVEEAPEELIDKVLEVTSLLISKDSR